MNPLTIASVASAVAAAPCLVAIEVTDNVRALLPVFESQLPPSAHLLVRGDKSKNIREAFHDVQNTMLITLALVILVIFFFLRNVSATLIPTSDGTARCNSPNSAGVSRTFACGGLYSTSPTGAWTAPAWRTRRLPPAPGCRRQAAD